MTRIMTKSTLSLIALLLFCVTFTIAQTPTEMPVGRRFYIQSAINFGKDNGGYWDVPGRPSATTDIARGSNIQVWTLDNHHDREFTLIETSDKGYYEIQVGNTRNSRVDVADGKREDRTNIQTWDRNGNIAQRFLFHHMGDGRFKIFYRNKKALCLAGRSSNNGSNVHLWGDHNGPWMEWYLIDVQTKKPFIPSSAPVSTLTSASTSNLNISLQPGEEFVYGKVGLFPNGDVKYTFAMVRKPNRNKELYNRELLDPYSGPHPILSGGQLSKNNNPAEYDLYDYWVIFNGQRLGPYDRIYEMYQRDGNVDDWVNDCGKFISFAAVKGQQYIPVIANRPSNSFWKLIQAPDFDAKSGKQTFALKWGNDEVRLVENGQFKLMGWKRIEKVQYSSNGNDLLYVGGETDRNVNFVYVNHQKFAGPFNIVGHKGAGFIPETNVPYAFGFTHDVVDGMSVANYDVTIGKRKFSIPKGYGVGNPEFAGDWVSFTVTQHHKNQNDPFKASTISVYEYNYKTDELKKHEGYAYTLSHITPKGSSVHYYSTSNSKGDAHLVKQGGEILHTVPRNLSGENAVRFIVGNNGDFVTVYGSTDDKQQVLYNGKPFALAGNTVARVEYANFCEETSNLQMVIAIDKSVGARKKRFISAQNQFEMNGDFYHMEFATNSNDIFISERDVNSTPWTWRIYKNNQPLLTEKFNTITEFSISPNAQRYAAMVYNGKNPGGYFTENYNMHEKWELLVDGKIVGSNFGAPVWSTKKNKFIVLQQVGSNIRLIEL
jgi:hypothetical protein